MHKSAHNTIARFGKDLIYLFIDFTITILLYKMLFNENNDEVQVTQRQDHFTFTLKYFLPLADLKKADTRLNNEKHNIKNIRTTSHLALKLINIIPAIS
ncbi:hypothetical protein DSLASN_21030 [Desulfoluna limicola]|uniref:Transposase n=1 Tax=Desulfoluna limicola TaxID=2810562 RepID=A0ABN6F4Q5_9BACT|nr:hypothetical protein DSLASN_21030 [Desulfoluna limicola]